MSNLLPDAWKEVVLGEHAYIKARIGWRGLSSSEYTESGPYLIAGTHIRGKSIDWENCHHINKFRYDESPEIQLQDMDVIISKDGTIGRLGFIENMPGLATINGTMMLIRPDDHFYSKFIYFYLQGDQFQKIVREKVSGSSVPHIFQRDMVTLPVPLPPIPEQQKIAKILTSVDDVIEKTQAQIDKLKDLKTGMMQELLTNGVGHTEFKDSPVGRIPAEWDVDTLDNISKVIDCKHATPKYYPVGYAVVKPGNIKEGNLDLSGCALTDKAGFDNLNENHLPVIGDTIYSRNQTYGIGAYVNEAMNFAVGQDVCIIHPKKCEPKFTYYVVNSPVVREQVELLAAGSTFKRINLGSIRKLFIPVPTKTEQVLISNALSSIDEKMEYVLAKLKSLKMTKKALMQDLLTGKVRVKVDSE